MQQFTRRQALTALTAMSVMALSAPAWAIYRQLSTSLSGPAINGVTPSGDAKVDQSRLPTSPGQLQARIQNVNLSNGTTLGVYLGGNAASAELVGTITLNQRGGSLSVALPGQVGRNDILLIKNGDTVVLTGGATWKV